MVHSALQHIRDVVLEIVIVTFPEESHEIPMMQSMMECYNVKGGPDDEDDPRNINILGSKGSQNIAALDMSTDKFHQPLKIQEVNIGIEEEPKFTNIGDYWDEETMANIHDLLHEFQELFSTKFLEMEGILGYLGEMKIPLNPYQK